jgi:predicted metal-dependent phosphoesterase TrpH
VRIDLHTHSNRSDGTDTPSELVRNAARVGLDVVALTDHDTTVGWAEAQGTADEVGIRLVKGIEISTKLEHKSIHLLGYEMDPADGPLVAELDRILGGRDDRLPRIVAALNEVGIDITEPEVRARSGAAEASGRPHVADVLVDKGVVADRNEAFDAYLNPGRPGYVSRYAVPTDAAIRLVTAAGGVTVLAHPWSRGSHRVLTADRIAALAGAGLSGLEVDHPDHDPEQRRQLRGLAEELGLAVTGSSDYHGLGKSDAFALGVNTTAPEELEKLLSAPAAPRA